jgi:hypothetical protein
MRTPIRFCIAWRGQSSDACRRHARIANVHNSVPRVHGKGCSTPIWASRSGPRPTPRRVYDFLFGWALTKAEARRHDRDLVMHHEAGTGP